MTDPRRPRSDVTDQTHMKGSEIGSKVPNCPQRVRGHCLPRGSEVTVSPVERVTAISREGQRSLTGSREGQRSLAVPGEGVRGDCVLALRAGQGWVPTEAGGLRPHAPTPWGRGEA